MILIAEAESLALIWMVESLQRLQDTAWLAWQDRPSSFGILNLHRKPSEVFVYLLNHVVFIECKRPLDIKHSWDF
jgi:hypothetical protein